MTKHWVLVLCFLAYATDNVAEVMRCPNWLSDDTDCANAPGPLDCPEGYKYVEDAVGCSNCPGCIKYRGFNESCRSATEPSVPYEVTMVSGVPLVQFLTCGPGLACVGDGDTCDLARSAPVCVQHLVSYTKEEHPKPYEYEPVCDLDGNYMPVQCQGGSNSGTCFCVTPEGERIFGRDLPSKRKEMNCACSRHVWQLKQDGRRDVTLHCALNGNYEPLQCDEDLCFCVNSTTAQPYGGTVSRDQWEGLPCYSAGYFPGGYNRQCESMNVAATKLSKVMTAHGVMEMNLFTACDPDGSYYPKHCSTQDQLCKCRDRAGNNIGPYAVDASHSDEVNSMNCQCARDRNDNDPISLRTRSLYCSSDGNYKPEQCDDEGQCFCVDDWGVKTSLSVYTNIEGVEQLIRCCLPCLDPKTLQCESKRPIWASHCPEDPPDWTNVDESLASASNISSGYMQADVPGAA